MNQATAPASGLNGSASTAPASGLLTLQDNTQCAKKGVIDLRPPPVPTELSSALSNSHGATNEGSRYHQHPQLCPTFAECFHKALEYVWLYAAILGYVPLLHTLQHLSSLTVLGLQE